MSEPLFDPAPLLSYAQVHAHRTAGRFGDGGKGRDFERFPQPYVHAIAEMLGVAPITVHRYRNGARVRRSTADRIATRLGLHPSLLWTEWWQ